MNRNIKKFKNCKFISSKTRICEVILSMKILVNKTKQEEKYVRSYPLCFMTLMKIASDQIKYIPIISNKY